MAAALVKLGVWHTQTAPTARPTRTRTRTRTRASTRTRTQTRARARTRRSPSLTPTLRELYGRAQQLYFEHNKYEFSDYIKRYVYPSNVGQRTETFDRDMKQLICAAPGGLPDYAAIARLAKRYRNGTRYKRDKTPLKFWPPNDWGVREVSLVDAVKKARRHIAKPSAVWGHAQAADLRVADLVG